MATTTAMMSTKLVLCLLAPGGLLLGCAGAGAKAGSAGPIAEEKGPTTEQKAATTEGQGAAAGPKGTKKLNKYTGNAAAIQQGRALYLQYGCSGCHGVGGGGGMAVPLVDDVWKFGSDDATLFKLIKGQIPEQTMPKVYNAMPDDEVWKILSYVRSLYAGDPQKIDW